MSTSVSVSQIYLLGALLMAARTFWRTRDRRCPTSNEVVKPYTAIANGQTYNLRFVLIALLATFWPLAVAAMIASRLVDLTRPGSDDDAPST